MASDYICFTTTGWGGSDSPVLSNTDSSGNQYYTVPTLSRAIYLYNNGDYKSIIPDPDTFAGQSKVTVVLGGDISCTKYAVPYTDPWLYGKGCVLELDGGGVYKYTAGTRAARSAWIRNVTLKNCILGTAILGYNSVVQGGTLTGSTTTMGWGDNGLTIDLSGQGNLLYQVTDSSNSQLVHLICDAPKPGVNAILGSLTAQIVNVKILSIAKTLIVTGDVSCSYLTATNATVNIGGSLTTTNASTGSKVASITAESATLAGSLTSTGDVNVESLTGGEITVGGTAMGTNWSVGDLAVTGGAYIVTLDAEDVSVAGIAAGTTWTLDSLTLAGTEIPTTATTAGNVTELVFNVQATPLPYADITRVWQVGGTYTTDMDGTTSAATPGSSDVVYFGTDGIDLGSATYTCAKCYVAANCSVDVAGITCNEVVLEDGAEITGYGSLTWIGHTATSAAVLEKFHLEASARFVAKNCNISDCPTRTHKQGDLPNDYHIRLHVDYRRRFLYRRPSGERRT